MEKLVEVSDQEIRIEFALGTKCRSTITLKSLSSKHPVAFKVQTSSPQKFLVNPPGGIIPPLSSTSFQVILKPQNKLPSTFPRSPSDRFLIRTVIAPLLNPNSFGSTAQPEAINSWFNSLPSDTTTHDLKLKVAFVGAVLLRHAVGTGDYESVRSLIKRQRSLVPDLSSRDSESLYRVAMGNNSEEIVDLLIESGLKIESRPGTDDKRWLNKGWTELHVAVAFDRTEEVKRILRSKEGVVLDARDKEGRTPLHLAANRGYLRSAGMLIAAGAKVDARSDDGRTPLFRAAANGDRRMVEVLVEMGANPTISEIEPGCRSAIDVARDKGENDIVKILEQGEAVLHAARRGELELLESLLNRGATMNFSDQYGLSALHMAAIKGNKDAVMILLEYGADLECQDGEGHTPLHLAVEGGSFETVELLINRGADVNAISKKGATALQVSSLLGLEEILQLLLAASEVPSARFNE